MLYTGAISVAMLPATCLNRSFYITGMFKHAV